MHVTILRYEEVLCTCPLPHRIIFGTVREKQHNLIAEALKCVRQLSDYFSDRYLYRLFIFRAFYRNNFYILI